MPLVLGSGASLMVVKNTSECCDRNTHNFKIHSSVSVHVVDIVQLITVRINTPYQIICNYRDPLGSPRMGSANHGN